MYTENAYIYFFDLICFGRLIVVDFRVNEAVMYGAYMLGQSLVYAPSFNSAKACGARILSIINRTPKVRTEDGVKDKRDWVRNTIK